MKIISVESSVVALPCSMGGPAPLFAGKPWTHLEMLLVRVETEDGLVGWGEAFGHAAIPTTKSALDSIVAPLVVGRDAGDINALTRDILHSVHLLGRNGPFVYAFSGVEIALWDILGKRTGQPLYRLLGGRRCTQLAAYSSLLHYGNPELVSENTRAACAQGFRHIKLHEVTRQNVLAASGAAANAHIMLDVNCAWSVPVACEVARSLANDRLTWLEEPVWRAQAEVERVGVCVPLSGSAVPDDPHRRRGAADRSRDGHGRD